MSAKIGYLSIVKFPLPIVSVIKVPKEAKMERIHSGKVYQLYNILQFQEVKQFSNYLAIRALTST